MPCCSPAAAENNAILPYWDDLYQVNGSNGIYTSTSGVAPNRIFNIEWRGQYFPGSGSVNFEARLHETTNQIDLVYNTATNGIASATAGLQQGTGTVVDQLFCNGSGQAISSGFEATYTCAGATCQLTCPANITMPNDAGQCGAVATFAPTATGNCGTVTCTPASGSLFAVGTTPVTCSTATGSASCSFNVTVNDVEPPVIGACPADITDQVPPLQTGKIETFTDPTATDNCSATVGCVPPSGSQFPVGNTVDTCTATDPSGNTSSCSFNVDITQLTTQEIPALGATGLAMLALLLGAMAVVMLRRRM